MTPALVWGWRVAPQPPAPHAAVAWGGVAARLLDRLAHLDSPQAHTLSGCAGADVVVLLGDADHLPWVDGLQYAAPSADAPALWLPTLRHPDLPHDLMARALSSHHRRAPLLLWPDPDRVVPLDRPSPVSGAWVAHARRVLGAAA